MEARRESFCRNATRGRERSSSVKSLSWIATSSASGKYAATPTMRIPGSSSASPKATDRNCLEMTQGIEAKPITRSIIRWFEKNARDLPWRRTRDPYGIWISEVMLQQTQVKTVIPYWERWMALFPDVRTLASAPEERLLHAWEGLGYYTRARNLQRAARIICEEHGGEFPRDFEQVLELPGIGRYTAGAICSIAFGQPT